VEKEIFGATHGEIGAYLLGLWGMPLDLLEVAALHHHPASSLKKTFTALTAVHIANVLEREITPDQDGLVTSKLDGVYLAEVGVLDRVGEWRTAVSKRDFSKPEIKVRTAKPSAAIAPSPVLERKASTVNDQPVTGAGFFKNEWVYGGVGAVIALVVIGWLSFKLLISDSTKVAARTAPEVVATANVAPVPVTPAKPVPAPSPAPVVAAPTPVIAPHVETVVAAPAPVKPASGFADMKLQGIFYSANHPSAIINGHRVEPNQRLGEVLVVGITSSTVTLEYQQRRKTLVLE